MFFTSWIANMWCTQNKIKLNNNNNKNKQKINFQHYSTSVAVSVCNHCIFITLFNFIPNGDSKLQSIIAWTWIVRACFFPLSVNFPFKNVEFGLFEWASSDLVVHSQHIHKYILVFELLTGAL